MSHGDEPRAFPAEIFSLSHTHTPQWHIHLCTSLPAACENRSGKSHVKIMIKSFGRRHGKITFVDLAGSERLKVSKSEGTTLKETGAINKSIFTLGKVSCLPPLSLYFVHGVGHVPLYRGGDDFIAV